MRLLVCEFITGGGLLNAPLPETLAREGELMLRALVNDLADCRVVEHIDVLRDTRLEPISRHGTTCLPVNLDFMQTYIQGCARADAVLPVAPESGGALLQLTRQAEARFGPASARGLLGSDSAAVALAGSKRETIEALQPEGLPVIPVLSLAQAHERADGCWVVKPDDGVAGDNCRKLDELPAQLAAGEILQPHVSGRPASLSLLCADGHARLLAVNEQHLELDARGCRAYGVHVNGLLADQGPADMQVLQRLTAAVAAAMPGLWGFVGVDLIMTGNGPLIVEVNPRVTTAYAGLRESLDVNPAELLLELAHAGELPAVALERARPVEVWL